MARARTLRFLRGLALLEFVVLAAPGASAVLRDLEIQPGTSYVNVLPTSGIWLDLLEPVGSVFMPFEAQAPGVASTTTSLAGWLRIDELLDFSVPTLQITAARTGIRAATSGSWHPGSPSAPATAAPAAIAVGWDGFWLGGEAALRDLAFTGAASWPAQVVTPGEHWRWPAPPFTGPIARKVELHVQGGLVDLDVPLIPDLRLGLSEAIRVALTLSDAKRGEIRRFENKLQLVLPIDVSKELGPNDFETGLPVRVQLDLAGRIVAQEVGYAPEPAAAVQLAAAVVVLSILARRPIRDSASAQRAVGERSASRWRKA